MTAGKSHRRQLVVNYVADLNQCSLSDNVTNRCTYKERLLDNQCVHRRDVTPESISSSFCRTCAIDRRREVKSEG